MGMLSIKKKSVVPSKIKGSFLCGLAPTNWLLVLEGILLTVMHHIIRAWQNLQLQEGSTIFP